MDEDEMVQVAAKRTLIEHGIIVLEVVIRMEVDVKVIHDVVEEVLNFLYRRYMRLLCVLCHHIQELSANTQKRTGSTLCDDYKRKAWVLNICLLYFEVYHNLAKKQSE